MFSRLRCCLFGRQNGKGPETRERQKEAAVHFWKRPSESWAGNGVIVKVGALEVGFPIVAQGSWSLRGKTGDPCLSYFLKVKDSRTLVCPSPKPEAEKAKAVVLGPPPISHLCCGLGCNVVTERDKQEAGRD